MYSQKSVSFKKSWPKLPHFFKRKKKKVLSLPQRNQFIKMAVPSSSSPNPKFCTACGSKLLNRFGKEVPELFDAELFQKSKILKLRDCQNCYQVADKYVEQDGVLVLIDLTLQTKSAYRHVLLNGNYAKLILKMVLLAVIGDGYIAWAGTDEAGEQFFEQEYQFYVACLKVLGGKFLKMCTDLF